MSDRIKIRLYGKHVAYLSKSLYGKFLKVCNILDYSVWLKELAYVEYSLKLTDADSLDSLKTHVIADDYEDIADWLREKMRKDMRKSNKIKNLEE